jgi:hypothetical protein
MARHRGKYNTENPVPYELSRYRIESFIKCPACFWMDRVRGIKFPGMPGFLLNTATDTLLKKDFDHYRQLQQPHPFMIENGLDHLVPLQHEDFEQWTKSLQLGFRTEHRPSNMIIGGGLDDVWHDLNNDCLFIVDYKSTASRANNEKTALAEVTLEGAYKKGYKRQMEIYQWIMRQNGFNVSDTVYFVYVNGDQHFQDGMLKNQADNAIMRFDIQLIEYQGNDSWIEQTIFEIKDCLERNDCPEHSSSGFGPKGDKQCEYAQLFEGMKENQLEL